MEPQFIATALTIGDTEVQPGDIVGTRFGLNTFTAIYIGLTWDAFRQPQTQVRVEIDGGTWDLDINRITTITN
jgi:hypothetical protein